MGRGGERLLRPGRARREGRGDTRLRVPREEPHVGLGAPADFAAYAGITRGTLDLFADPSIATVADLKGKSIGVDAMATGFAHALRAMLAKAGLREGERDGFIPGARLDAAGMATVLRVRSEYGRPRKELMDPSRYVDDSIPRDARQ